MNEYFKKTLSVVGLSALISFLATLGVLYLIKYYIFNEFTINPLVALAGVTIVSIFQFVSTYKKYKTKDQSSTPSSQ